MVFKMFKAYLYILDSNQKLDINLEFLDLQF